MDLAKAFDKVPHERLLHKLDYYGIRRSGSGRSHQVVLDGQASDPVPVLSGVPHWSGFGLRADSLFNLHKWVAYKT